MVEQRGALEYTKDPQYLTLVKSIYDDLKASLKDGFRTKVGSFRPTLASSSPMYGTEFNPQTSEALFSISEYIDFVKSSMTYRIKEGEAVFKIGPQTDEDAKPAVTPVGLEELKDVAKLIEDPTSNAHLAERILQLHIYPLNLQN